MVDVFWLGVIFISLLLFGCYLLLDYYFRRKEQLIDNLQAKLKGTKDGE